MIEIPQYMRHNIEIKLHQNDKWLMPYRAHPTDAGADLTSIADHIIYPGDKAMVDTGVSIRIPLGYAGLVYNRSSQGKVRVSLANSVGVIDTSYRGNIKVLLVNEGEDPYVIANRSTRIAQLVITPCLLAEFSLWEATHKDKEWEDTDRGVGGFGSTGT